MRHQNDTTFDLKINVGHCHLHFMVQWFCLISWRLWWMNIIIWDYESVWPEVWLQNKYKSLWPVMVQWFCVTAWRLFDVWISYFGIMGQYDPTFDLKINSGLCDLYFMVQWFCLISPKTWCMSVIFSDNETLWPKRWPQSKYKSTWPIFHDLMILLNVFKILWWMNIIVGLMDQCGT